MLSRNGNENQDDLNSGRNAHNQSNTSELSPRSYNARLGLGLFLVYFALYAAIVWLSFGLLETVDSSRLAFIFGTGLVVSALVLAAVYSRFSRPESRGNTIVEMDSVSVRL